jgi:hypothetical protein
VAVPVPVYRIDLNNDGDFGDANEDVTSRVLSASWTRGASATFVGEATGALTLILSNDDAFFDDTNMLPGCPSTCTPRTRRPIARGSSAT